MWELQGSQNPLQDLQVPKRKHKPKLAGLCTFTSLRSLHSSDRNLTGNRTSSQPWLEIQQLLLCTPSSPSVETGSHRAQAGLKLQQSSYLCRPSAGMTGMPSCLTTFGNLDSKLSHFALLKSEGNSGPLRMRMALEKHTPRGV